MMAVIHVASGFNSVPRHAWKANDVASFAKSIIRHGSHQSKPPENPKYTALAETR